ncbi:unnamed protein product [Polarella glacialis]|uniref:Uncharacterized protein n=1 Tax=Polarella glacialis TaxID=89957 RepID=A0A813J7B0_POLGL|nr:unnamed protein product [Polarella glacialis]CAE8667081.1 unnamed protein product [Polarella glacialis]
MEFEGASTVAQIIQGVAFLGLAIFLIFANNAKVGSSAKAPLEQRYMTACTIATAICLFSGFFNILQMTGLDNFDLPRQGSANTTSQYQLLFVFVCYCCSCVCFYCFCHCCLFVCC